MEPAAEVAAAAAHAVQPRHPAAGLLARRLRLGQLALAVAATAAIAVCEDGVLARYMMPAAALQCAWAAAAAIADVHGRRAPPLLRWASLVLDGVTALATLAAASGALGVAHAIVTNLCAQEPVLCQSIVGAAPKALLAWAALQAPASFFFMVQVYVHASRRSTAAV